MWYTVRNYAPVCSTSRVRSGHALMSESLSAVAIEAYRARVLIVENDENAARFFAKALDEEGYDTEICLSSDAALIAAEQGCEVIITAVRGPGMDGLEAARNLKKIMPDVPLMMLTCYHSSAAEQEALASGVSAVFSKPDGMQNLIWTARAVLKA